MHRGIFGGESAGNREAKEDLFFGQIVVIVARWFLILSGVIFTLWSATNVAAVTVPVLFIALLMAMNFYLHARYLMKQPVNGSLVTISSWVDVAIITGMVLLWRQGSGAGLASPFFVCYYAVLLAFALVFPPRLSLGFAGAVVLLYLASVLTISGIGDLEAQKALVERLLTMGATAGLGAYYWRIERGRRSRALQSVSLERTRLADNRAALHRVEA